MNQSWNNPDVGAGGKADGVQARSPEELAEAAVAAAIKYMKEQAGPNAPNDAQEKVIRDYFKVGPPKQLLVIGPPGTGKSTLFQACARGVIAMGGVPHKCMRSTKVWMR